MEIEPIGDIMGCPVCDEDLYQLAWEDQTVKEFLDACVMAALLAQTHMRRAHHKQFGKNYKVDPREMIADRLSLYAKAGWFIHAP